MKIRVEETKKKELRLSEEEPATQYPALLELEKAGECRFVAPVTVEVSAFWEYDHVRVTGQLQTRIRLACSRCLTEYEEPVSSHFTIFYTEAKKVELEEEVELSDQELISVNYEGDEIDLDFEIAEQVMMEIPYKPLCTEACRGLCPQCGADLNQGECGCDRGGVNLKMSVLKQLKLDK